MGTFAIIWFLCGIPAAIMTHGFYLAYFWHEYPTLQSPERFCHLYVRNIVPIIAAILNPPFAILYAFQYRKHGMMFRYPKNTP